MNDGQTRWPPQQVLGWTLLVVVCLLTAVLPSDTVGWSAFTIAAEVIAVVAFAVALHRMTGRSAIIWWLLWTYAATVMVADVIYTIQENVLDEPAFPGPADVPYFASYLALIGALIVLVRCQHPGRDREAWIDSAIMTGAIVSAAGTFVVAPLLAESEAASLATTMSVAYPVLDLIAVSVLIRLLVGFPGRLVSLLLVTLATAITLVADFAYNVLVLYGTEADTPGWVEALYVGAILMLPLAAMQPDARAIASTVEREHRRVSATRRLGLSVGVLTPPILLAVVSWDSGEARARLLAITSVAVIGLVLWRTLLLLATVERQAAGLAEQARTDPLTGLANRRTWQFQLDRVAAQTAAAGSPLVIAMLDLDHFKQFNDEHGHLAGDEQLVRCSQAWRAQIPAGWFLARYGGEEFALLIPGVPIDDARALLDDVRQATPGGQTVSIGCARRAPGEPPHQTLDRADQALYVAKQEGRDRVVVAPDPLTLLTGTAAPAP